MAAHSSILAWEIPWTEEPGGLQSMGSQRAGHDLVTKPPVNPTDAQPSNNQFLNHHLVQDSCSNLRLSAHTVPTTALQTPPHYLSPF